LTGMKGCHCRKPVFQGETGLVTQMQSAVYAAERA
jgi:hypothetical protein